MYVCTERKGHCSREISKLPKEHVSEGQPIPYQVGTLETIQRQEEAADSGAYWKTEKAPNGQSR